MVYFLIFLLPDDMFASIDAELNNLGELYPDFVSDSASSYYDIDKFNSVLGSGSPHNVSLVHYNVRSLLPKIDVLLSELSLLETKFDVICISETWLTEGTKQLALLEGY